MRCRARNTSVLQNPSGQGAGRLTVSDKHLTIHHGGVNPGCTLTQAYPVLRQVGGHLRHQRGNVVGIKDGDIRLLPHPQETTVVETPASGNLAGDPADRFFKAECTSLSDPMAQEMRMQREIRNLTDVRTGVGKVTTESG